MYYTDIGPAAHLTGCSAVYISACVKVAMVRNRNQTRAATGPVERKLEFLTEPLARHTVEQEVDGGVDNDTQLRH